MNFLVPLALLLLAAACASVQDKPDLALACQLTKCVCAAPESVFVESPPPKPVLWKENGDAYCPEGYQLKEAKE